MPSSFYQVIIRSSDINYTPHFKRPTKTGLISNLKGFSLIEVLVTIIITSIGLMGLVSLQMQAVRATTDSGNRSQAVWIFNDIINRIHANEAASASYVTPANFIIPPLSLAREPTACANVVVPVCSAYHDGNNVFNAVASCTGPQQAAWDLYEVACQLRDLRYGDSITYLPQAQLAITCAAAPCDNGDPLTITLQWRAKADNESITGAARSTSSGQLSITDVITP
jgi:type IV pilus assembly protein PilV